MNADDIETVAVIGAGDMGHGIAEVSLLAGHRVFLHDIKQEFIDRGVRRIDDSLKRLTAKGKVAASLYDRIHAELLNATTDLNQAVRQADLVIEAVPEVLDLKQQTFKTLDALAPARAILASNTSTMSIARIGKATSRPQKVVGLHYFNPAVLMPIVEVIKAEDTSEETMQTAQAFCEKCGKKPVRVNKDVPGFIFNRVHAPGTVLLRCILDEGIAEPAEVDSVMRKLGAPMGPFETMDYTGLDINVNVSNYFAETLHSDYAPGRAIQELVAKGDLGKKTGKGIYDWSAGRPSMDAPAATGKFDPDDLLAVIANEATKLVEMEVASAEDIDKVVAGASGSAAGPFELIQGWAPEDLTARLEGLAIKYGKEIFKPSRMIREGTYRK